MKLPPDVERKVLELAGVTNAAPLADTISEKDFQAAVIAEAERQGWLVYHTHDSRRSQPGFPDLVLVRERVVFAELKSAEGRQTAEQAQWADALVTAKAEFRYWRPADWPQIVNLLKGCD